MNIFQYIQASIDHLDRCEDAMVVLAVPGRAPVLAVIDGMGGHQHRKANGKLITGAEAATLAREALIETLVEVPEDVSAAPNEIAEQRLLAAVTAAHRRIYTELNEEENLPDYRRVGAVLTVALVCENGSQLLVSQVGDTRAYLVRDDGLTQLCPDEDNVAFMVRQGMINTDDAAQVTALINDYDGYNEPKPEGEISIGGGSYELTQAWRWFMVGNTSLSIPGSNVVMSAIGIDRELAPPVTGRFPIEKGTVLMMCTDGVHKNLSEPEMHKFLHAHAPSADRATLLGEAAFARSRDRANRRSARDDITVIVAQF